MLKCGRRFGKTDLTKELAIQPILDGFPVGYWTPTYKDVNKVWDEIKFTLHGIIQSKDEQLKQLKLITGGQLDLWSLESPDNGRGFAYKRVIIDEAEKARHLKKAWEETIRGTLTDYKGDAWFMSTPKFGMTYFKSTLFTNEQKFDNWKSWRFTSYDNPHLPDGEIEEIKSQLDDLVFRCEYLAEDVDINDSPWAWAFSKEKHVAKDLSLPVWNGDRNHYLYLSFDFNRNPITCAVIQHIDGVIYVIEQIKLKDSDIYKLCEVIKVKYGGMMFIITGDATGQSKSALVKDNLTYYKIIQRELSVRFEQFKLPTVNPRLEDNVVLVNSILCKYNVQIHPKQAEALIYDLVNVKTRPDGDIIKDDRNDPAQQADALDCFRYWCNQFMKAFVKSL